MRLVYDCEASVKSIFYQLTPDSTIDCQKLCKSIQQLILENTKDSSQPKGLYITITDIVETNNKFYLENKPLDCPT